MYKLTDPFSGGLIGFSELPCTDKIIDRITQEARDIICELTSEVAAPAFTAEQWLDARGFNSTRLVTLLDLESQLKAASATSPKLAGARMWINGILASFLQSPVPRSDWPEPPFNFEETTQEAFAALTS